MLALRYIPKPGFESYDIIRSSLKVLPRHSLGLLLMLTEYCNVLVASTIV